MRANDILSGLAFIVFSLAFGDSGNGGFIGNLDYAFLKDVGLGKSPEPFFEFLTIPFRDSVRRCFHAFLAWV